MINSCLAEASIGADNDADEYKFWIMFGVFRGIKFSFVKMLISLGFTRIALSVLVSLMYSFCSSTKDSIL